MDFVKETVPGTSDRNFRNPNLTSDEEPMAGFTGKGTATDPYDGGNAPGTFDHSHSSSIHPLHLKETSHILTISISEQPGNPLEGRHQVSAARLSQDAGNRVSVGGVAVPADKSHSTPLGASKAPLQHASLERPGRFEEDLSPRQAPSGFTGSGGLPPQQGSGGQRTSASGFDREPSGLHSQQGIGGQRTNPSGFDREPNGQHGIGGQRTSGSGFDREPSGLQSQHGIGGQHTSASGFDSKPSGLQAQHGIGGQHTSGSGFDSKPSGLQAQQGLGGQHTSGSGFDREPSGLHKQHEIGGQRTSASGFDREPSGLHTQQGIGGQRTSASALDRDPSGLQAQQGIGSQRTTASGLDRDSSLDTGSMPHKDVVGQSGKVDRSGLSGGSKTRTNDDVERTETQTSIDSGPRRSVQGPPIPQENNYKSSGLAAEGGDFDASASGAGREADRMFLTTPSVILSEASV